MRILRHHSSRGFTLLELIVAIVILAILATLAVPTFEKVIERTKDEKAKIEMQAFQRAAWAEAAMDQLAAGEDIVYAAEYFDPDDDYTGPLASASGTYAAGKTPAQLDIVDGPSTRWAEVSVWFEQENLKMAMMSEAEHCIRLAATGQQIKDVWVDAESGGEGEEPCQAAPPTILFPEPDPDRPLLSGLFASGKDNTILLSWAPVSGATSYQLYRDGAAQPLYSGRTAEYSSCYEGTRLCIVDGDLDRGTRYSYELVATNNAGSSGRSVPVSARTAPNTPENLEAREEGAEVVVTWNETAETAGYRLFRSKDNGPYTMVALGPSSLVRYDDTAVTRGSRYTYQIEAYNEAGDSPRSEIVNVILKVNAVLLEGVAQGTVGKLTWEPVAGSTGYQIYRDSTLIHTVPNGQANSWTNTGLAHGTTYTYHVVTLAPAGPSDSSNVVSITTVPSAPALGAYDADSASALNVTWSAPKDAVAYELRRSTNSNMSGYTVIQNGTQTSRNDTGLASGRSYYYQVVVTGSTGLTTTSAVAGETTRPPTMSAPLARTINDWSGALAVYWDPYPGATYIVERWDGDSGTWNRVYTGTDDDQWVRAEHTTDGAAKSHYFRITQKISTPHGDKWSPNWSANSNTDQAWPYTITAVKDKSAGKLYTNWPSYFGSQGNRMWFAGGHTSKQAALNGMNDYDRGGSDTDGAGSNINPDRWYCYRVEAWQNWNGKSYNGVSGTRYAISNTVCVL